ncbi:hypothetical protein D3C76_701520 [compost metagenome]
MSRSRRMAQAPGAKRLEDSLPEGNSFRMRRDPGHMLVEPGANATEHRVIMGIVSVPGFPQRSSAIVDHIPVTGTFF